MEVYRLLRQLKRWGEYNMSAVNDVVKEVEEETKYIMVDGKPIAIKAVLDRILNEDKKKKKRKLSKG